MKEKRTKGSLIECKTCGSSNHKTVERCSGCGYKMKDRIDIIRAIQVHAVTNDDDKRSGEKGWVHTHGMSQLGFAELEIRKVPLFLVAGATRFLNHLADYMVNGPKPVKVDQTYSDGYGVCRLVKATPIIDDQDVIASHYMVERWLLTDEPMDNLCGSCESHKQKS